MKTSLTYTGRMGPQRHVVPDSVQSEKPADGREDLVLGSAADRVPVGVLREIDLAGREHAGPIVAADGQFVRAVEADGVGHVDLERLVAAEAAADVLAVDVDAAVVLHAAEMDLDPLAAHFRRHGKRPPQPRPLVVGAAKVARHGAAFPLT